MSADEERRPGAGEPGIPADAFDRIVEHWTAEGTVPDWPAEADDTAPEDDPGIEQQTESRWQADRSLVEWSTEELFREEERRRNQPESPAALPPVTHEFVVPDPPRPPRARDPLPAKDEEEDHFVPPEPPPLPAMGPPIVVGLVLIVLGLLLIVRPAWIGLGSTYGLPLGLLALAAGLGWLVLRLWNGGGNAHQTADGDGPDDGAVL
ncbi:MAG: hypothetical protein OJJ54_07885 [Pseudonocardia sp.]|nr:hypothetical protein [Pseudonocardia sp.]